MAQSWQCSSQPLSHQLRPEPLTSESACFASRYMISKRYVATNSSRLSFIWKPSLFRGNETVGISILRTGEQYFDSPTFTTQNSIVYIGVASKKRLCCCYFSTGRGSGEAVSQRHLLACRPATYVYLAASVLLRHLLWFTPPSTGAYIKITIRPRYISSLSGSSQGGR
ncbi:hypothetical protein CC80DRAFT_13480 [Byssothecium circinans]|uniref:Uncharacterized protein n=1 Tax=Byssothecium circinans TaxID=147558 RepID=A0A6A5ULK7_9PLEO|nr:hypothetical protein CC80DRAFT_13480 [Byssothecium circinans]